MVSSWRKMSQELYDTRECGGSYMGGQGYILAREKK